MAVRDTFLPACANPSSQILDGDDGSNSSPAASGSSKDCSEGSGGDEPVDPAASEPNRLCGDPAESAKATVVQLTGYARFREMLKHPSAQPVTLRLQNFVQKFPSGLPKKEAASKIHLFLKTTQDWMLSEIVVFAADSDETGKTDAAEGLEKFLLSRLHHMIFGVDESDVQQDAELHQRISSLSWVSFEHLGVPAIDPSLLNLAIKELRSVDDYKSPHDKLVCILNASRVINDVLKLALEDSGARGRPLSADDFLPILIFSVLRANPTRLVSNVEFVAEFRHPSRLNGEDAYFFTTLQSAVAFVSEISPKVLEVSQEEFDRRCAAAAEPKIGDDGPVPLNVDHFAPNARSIRAALGPTLDAVADDSEPLTVAAKAAKLPESSKKRLAQRLEELSLKFASVPCAQRIKLRDVETLAGEYKALAALLREVERGDFDS